ncbi:hypothetical protein [Candidatus Reidiella endopervernicosa]|nr:hypothetical protein [Candidatus Reidiella endopervernicosa]QKQ26364.1 hypothetical protein HUE57_08795 [Candidatus Reidiella endopervernicosa]
MVKDVILDSNKLLGFKILGKRDSLDAVEFGAKIAKPVTAKTAMGAKIGKAPPAPQLGAKIGKAPSSTTLLGAKIGKAPL